MNTVTMKSDSNINELLDFLGFTKMVGGKDI
jgi:hypothetical protein